MNNELQVFNYEEKPVRTIEQDGQTWWVLKDVCDVLGLSNPSIVVERLDEDERSKFNLGRQGSTNIINESGLYNVILRSDKPEAKKFKKWITSEVLPSIRKHGMYATIETAERILGDPDFLIKTLEALKAERAKRVALEDQATIDLPKVIFANAVSTSKTDILVSELAKLICQNGIDIGQKRLFQWLRENGYLINRKGHDYNSPTQKSMELGLFRIKETAIVGDGDQVIISKTSKVTGKGQQYFINKFLSSKIQHSLI